MDSLKEKILDKLEHLSETALHEILNFVDFLEWRVNCKEPPCLSVESDSLQEEFDVEWLESDLSNLDSYDPYDWQPGELDEGLPLKYVPGVGIVVVRE